MSVLNCTESRYLDVDDKQTYAYAVCVCVVGCVYYCVLYVCV